MVMEAIVGTAKKAGRIRYNLLLFRQRGREGGEGGGSGHYGCTCAIVWMDGKKKKEKASEW